MTWLIDRSRVLDYQACPRRRYLAYHLHGTGIQRIAKALPLVYGSAFHEGCELMLKGDVEGAVLRARLYLSNVFEEKGVAFEGEIPKDADAAWQYGAEEQAAMAEAMLRGFWAYEGEWLLRDFDVLEVEQEGRAELSKDMALMFRPDALVREKSTGDLYEISWKTCATFQQKTIKQAMVDMQSCSEVWGRENDPSAEKVGKIEGVLYKFASKGTRRKDNWDGLYKQGTHLIYGWMKREGTDVDWSWSYEWSDPGEINIKTGNPVSHKLGKGWKKVPIWREYEGGISAWIAALAANEIHPRDGKALEEAFPNALPVSRRVDEIESWKRSTIAQEERVRHDLGIIEMIEDNIATNGESPMEREVMLDELFPRHTNRCHDYSGCSMFDVCWTPSVSADPVASGLYKIRTETNHPEGKGGDE